METVHDIKHCLRDNAGTLPTLSDAGILTIDVRNSNITNTNNDILSTDVRHNNTSTKVTGFDIFPNPNHVNTSGLANVSDNFVIDNFGGNNLPVVAHGSFLSNDVHVDNSDLFLNNIASCISTNLPINLDHQDFSTTVFDSNTPVNFEDNGFFTNIGHSLSTNHVNTELPPIVDFRSFWVDDLGNDISANFNHGDFLTSFDDNFPPVLFNTVLDDNTITTFGQESAITSDVGSNFITEINDGSLNDAYENNVITIIDNGSTVMSGMGSDCVNSVHNAFPDVHEDNTFITFDDENVIAANIADNFTNDVWKNNTFGTDYFGEFTGF
jgi:hypothetical protein